VAPLVQIGCHFDEGIPSTVWAAVPASRNPRLPRDFQFSSGNRLNARAVARGTKFSIPMCRLIVASPPRPRSKPEDRVSVMRNSSHWLWKSRHAVDRAKSNQVPGRVELPLKATGFSKALEMALHVNVS
jgi:hypothetical protein